MSKSCNDLLIKNGLIHPLRQRSLIGCCINNHRGNRTDSAKYLDHDSFHTSRIPNFLIKTSVKMRDLSPKCLKRTCSAVCVSPLPWFLINHVILYTTLWNIYKRCIFALSVQCHVSLSLSETN